MQGFHGKCLTINLTKQSSSVSVIPKDILLKYLGGRGLGAYLLSKGEDAKLAWHDEKARIILTVGPLTNTNVPTSGQSCMTFKSPLTGLINASIAGGGLGARLKACGYDAVIITGKAPRLQTVQITNAGVKFINFDNLKQFTTMEAHSELHKKFGNAVSSACIGPAGENGVLFASVSVDATSSFSNGGAGAVWGAKNLKALVIEGDINTSSENTEKLDFLLYELKKQLSANPITSKALPEFGSCVFVNVMNQAGVMPAKNYLENYSSQAQSISGEELTDTYLINKHACYNCPIACGRTVQVSDQEGVGPEYETVYALGSVCGIYDLKEIIKANYLCNALGLDSISTGVTIACAMEMHSKGYLKNKINFGDTSSLQELINDIAFKRGLGAELAMGSKRFAALYEHPELAMHVKGLELSGYDPRGAQGQGLAYATSNLGGSHLSANMTLPEILGIPKMVDRDAVSGKAGLLIVMQHTYAIFDSLVLCKFIGYAISDEFLARILSAVSGVSFEPMDLQLIGERIWNTERMFNIHAGLNPSLEDTLPDRLLTEATKEGPAAGKTVNIKSMLAEYYRFRSWTLEGIPTKEKLAKLEMEL